MRNVLYAIVALALVGCSGKSGDATKLAAEGPSDIAVKGKVGDSYRYHVKTVIESLSAEEKGSMGFTADMTETLTKQEGDTFEWEMQFENIEAHADGVMKGAEGTFESLGGMKVVSVQDGRGTVKSLKLGDLVLPSEGSSNVVLPPKGVKVGDTWAGVLDLNGQKVPVTYRLDGYEKLDGVLAAKITGLYEDGGPAKSVEPTEFWVDTTNGKMLRGRAVTDMTIEGKDLRLTYEVDLVKPKG